MPFTSVNVGVNDFFEKQLIPYMTCHGTDEMLELVREIQESGNYYWSGVAFPDSSSIKVGGNQTVSGSLQIPTGSYVTAINYYSSQNAGCKFKVFDKGTKASIFYGDYALDRLVASNMHLRYGVGGSVPPSDPGMNSDNPYGPNYLMSPFIITPPGILGWEIVNLATVTAVIQFMMAVAVPITVGTINQVVVSKG